MNATVINVKTDPFVKSQIQAVAADLGFSVSALINAFMRSVIRTRAVSFSVKEEPSNWLVKQLKAAEKDIKLRRNLSPSFTNAQDAIAWLDNPKRKYVRKIR